MFNVRTFSVSTYFLLILRQRCSKRSASEKWTRASVFAVIINIIEGDHNWMIPDRLFCCYIVDHTRLEINVWNRKQVWNWLIFNVFLLFLDVNSLKIYRENKKTWGRLYLYGLILHYWKKGSSLFSYIFFQMGFLKVILRFLFQKS